MGSPGNFEVMDVAKIGTFTCVCITGAANLDLQTFSTRLCFLNGYNPKFLTYDIFYASTLVLEKRSLTQTRYFYDLKKYLDYSVVDYKKTDSTMVQWNVIKNLKVGTPISLYFKTLTDSTDKLIFKLKNENLILDYL